MLNFIENFLFKIDLKVVSIMKRKSVISLILRVGVRVPEFYMCVKDTGTKYQLWISDFNIDGTFTRVHPFIISHTKTMTRTREDSKEEVFSACLNMMIPDI